MTELLEDPATLLQPLFAGHVGAGATAAPLAGGHGGFCLWRIDASVDGVLRQLVVREVPSADEARRQLGIVRHLAAADALDYDGIGTIDTPELNAVVLPFVPGRNLLQLATSSPRWLARAGGVAAACLARLHAVPAPDLQATTWHDFVDDLADDPLAANYAEHMPGLCAAPPSAGSPVLCHGDLHPLNLIVGDDECAVPIDWAKAVVADPHWDVAISVVHVASGIDATNPVVRAGLRGLARAYCTRLLRTYRSMRPVDDRILDAHLHLAGVQRLRDILRALSVRTNASLRVEEAEARRFVRRVAKRRR